MKEKDFINVKELIRSKNAKLLKWLPRFVIRYLERIIHQDEANSILAKLKDAEGAEFCEKIIEHFNIQIEVEGIENIPLEGGATIAMNHPLGGMDAMALVDALKNHRTDIKFIVNDLLLNLKGMQSMFVGVNKHGKLNGNTVKMIDQVFESKGLVCVFPAGLVSRKVKGEVVDLDWKKTFIDLSIKHQNPIIPIYIDGKLSNFFYRLSNFRKFLGIKVNFEMLYLVDELFKQRNVKITFKIGKPIYNQDLDTSKSTKKLATWVKDQVYELAKK
jgi:putative hemolysin